MRHGRAAGTARSVPAVFFTPNPRVPGSRLSLPERQRGEAARATALALLVAALAGPTGCRPRDEVGPQSHLLQGSSMGTTWSVKVAAKDLSPQHLGPQLLGRLSSAIEGELAGVDERMSTYREDSELSRFNRRRETTPFAVSEATREVVAVAMEVGERSGGALDITVGPLVDAWGFGPWDTIKPPTDDEVESLRGLVGLDQLSLVPEGLVKKRPALTCDLSSVAKGYAVDRVGEALEGLGLRDYMVEVGGEVLASGANAEGRPWRIGIERPQLVRGRLQRIVSVSKGAMATSGDYRNYREIDGVRFSHIIDPRTGRPIRHRLASVSVVHERCVYADAWATALLVLGPEEGWDLALRERLAVFFIVREGDAFVERATPAFQEYLRAESGSPE